MVLTFLLLNLPLGLCTCFSLYQTLTPTSVPLLTDFSYLAFTLSSYPSPRKAVPDPCHLVCRIGCGHSPWLYLNHRTAILVDLFSSLSCKLLEDKVASYWLLHSRFSPLHLTCIVVDTCSLVYGKVNVKKIKQQTKGSWSFILAPTCTFIGNRVKPCCLDIKRLGRSLIPKAGAGNCHGFWSPKWHVLIY